MFPFQFKNTFRILFLWATLSLISYPSEAQLTSLKTDSFQVYGNCEQCKTRIEKAIHEMGIPNATWSVKSKMLVVQFDSLRFDLKTIKQKLAAVGHDTREFQADESIYDKLPACCHYTRFLPEANHSNYGSLQGSQTAIKDSLARIHGTVVEDLGKGFFQPVQSAYLWCPESGMNTLSDSLGNFELLCAIPGSIVLSYLGTQTDTLHFNTNAAFRLVLKRSDGTQLKEFVLSSSSPGTYISKLSPLNTRLMGTRELAKAACCNLSESFETSPSVDVSYADAVTGIRQIQLLGLSGTYTQLLTENSPELRGLSGSFGLTFIPGTWIESIQVTKGAGSVANGYESIAGQINIEEKKPDKPERLFANVYGNSMGRLEASLITKLKVSKFWSTALLAHYNSSLLKVDENQDGFMDLPIGRQFNLINRWKYTDTKGLFAQFLIKVLNDHRQGGQMDFDPLQDKLGDQHYGLGMDIQQYAFSGKIGYVFPQKAYKSIGFIFSGVDYTNHSYFGQNSYDAKQQSLYSSLIFQSIIGNTNHKYRAGLSFSRDNFQENMHTLDYSRLELLPGAFLEYTYTLKNLTLIAGIREDHHNEYGWITTPRLHLKYDLNAKTRLRFSAGSGFRVANIFSENAAVFVSSRQFSIEKPVSDYAYGLNPEKAWNYGLNFDYSFKIHNHAANLLLDLYRTDFQQQVVTDLDAAPNRVLFYNLSGQSFSNSFQGELNMELMKGLDLRLAFRWLDVQTDYQGRMLEKPFIAKERAFINLGYEFKQHWKLDYTIQWLSRKRLPNTSSNPLDYQLDAYSPAFFQMNAQISKQILHHWDLYLGGENLSNYRQPNAILAASQPFSTYFDASFSWGPIIGRMIYLGARYWIP